VKPAFGALWILTLGAAFGLGRLSATMPGTGPADLDSFRAALRERDALERAYGTSAFLRELDPGELPEALDAVEKAYLGMTPADVRVFMHAWARFDPAGALAWARNWPTAWSTKLTQEAAYAWGFHDGPGALHALEELDDPELQRSLRPSVLEGWLHSNDRQGVGDYVANVDDPRIRRRLTFTLASEVMKDGADEVIRWAEAIPEDSPNLFKQGTFYHGASVIAASEPRRAAEWFEAHREKWYSEGSLPEIARKWTLHHDAPAAFAWLRSLPPNEARADERARATAIAFRVWHRRDPAAAEAWLRGELPDPGLDPAVEELARALAAESPGDAAALALGIENEKLRRRLVTQIGQLWLEKEPAAASAWLAQSGLPEPVRKAILEGRRRPGGQPAAAGSAGPDPG
jgi:hypothetical protein